MLQRDELNKIKQPLTDLINILKTIENEMEQRIDEALENAERRERRDNCEDYTKK